MQNRAVRLCYDLRKYDHVSGFYHRLQWLPLSYFIQFKSLCLMYYQYHQVKCIPLEPPIVFGGTTYSTRTPVYFANIPMFRLCFTQRFFRYKTIQWWNALPSSVTDCRGVARIFGRGVPAPALSYQKQPLRDCQYFNESKLSKLLYFMQKYINYDAYKYPWDGGSTR